MIELLLGIFSFLVLLSAFIIAKLANIPTTNSWLGIITMLLIFTPWQILISIKVFKLSPKYKRLRNIILAVVIIWFAIEIIVLLHSFLTGNIT